MDALKTVCVDCGFHRFLSELPTSQPVGEVPTWVAEYRVVDTPELFRDFLAELKRQPRFCLDTETTDIDPLRASLVGIALSWEAGWRITCRYAGQSRAGFSIPTRCSKP